MPIPSPKDNEKESDFISRCMSNDTMGEEYPDNKQRSAVCYSAWRKKHPESAKHARLNEAKDGTFDITGVPIFAVGTWKKRVFEESDLDEMVHSFHALSNELKPGVKLGHVENIEGGVSAPRFGTVKRIYRQSKVLLADFTKVPKKVAEIIGRGGYPKISVELWHHFKNSAGKVFKDVIDAVALLGSETPEVSTLDDIVALYANRIEPDLVTFDAEDRDVEEYEFEVTITESLDAPPDEGGTEEEEAKMAEIEDLKKDLSRVEEERDKIKGEFEEYEKKVTEAEEKAKTAETELEKMSLEQSRKDAEAEAKTFFDGMAEKMIPAEREIAEPVMVAAMASQGSDVPMKFQKDDEEISIADAIKALFELRTELADGLYGQIFTASDPDKRGESAVALLDGKAVAYSKEHEVAYSTALRSVRADEPELAKQADEESVEE